MTKIHTRIEIKFDDVDTATIDKISKKIIGSLDEKELELMSGFNVLRFMASVEAPIK